MKNLIPHILIVLLFLGCKDRGPATIDAPSIELNYDNVHQFAIKKGKEDIAPSKFKWTSSNEKVGTVDGNGLFKARKIGQTKIIANGNGQTVESNVTVTPYNTFVVEPILDFSLDLPAIRARETGEVLFAGDYWIYFERDNESLRRVGYFFENGKLANAVLLFNYTLANMASNAAKFATFYNERYPIKENIRGKIAYVNDEKTLAIFYEHDEYIGYNATYYQYNNVPDKIRRIQLPDPENLRSK
ncbi:Ig-like domain (group 2) [Dyadobacter koreensis]|uniref:Ig-like domain (Group 2) n=1 Tax=Dyadobacter koreensis TaxID=408657 RepID=A0A1H6QF82_9BACT|nr:Ig-like domain-containing protein [Dyadobacter koreensis]SEI42369.1 Ig-like domain (group 2) [Dyadobacter koreensis]